MDEPDPEIFGPLVAIPAESLVLLASSIANKCLNLPIAGGKLVARISGSYNITHIVELESFKVVIRVPATGWGSGMTPTAALALESQAATLRLIRKLTTIPVPEIYALDTTDNNEIGAPYICMSFIPGKPVSEVWFDQAGTSPRDEFRLRILTSLSRTMAQFSYLSFDKIGSIMEDESGSTVVGPLFEWHEEEDGRLQIIASGPFASTSAFIQENPIAGYKENEWDKAEAKVLEALVGCLPTVDDQSDFVLCHPDFDSQNVLVDDEGTVTGLIDWDLAQTMPRFVGYARYPGWITRDWDPLMYGWPKMAESEDSPEALEGYRRFYNIKLGNALEWQGDWKLTEKSHILEAIWIAMLNYHNRAAICRKFIQIAAGGSIDALDILYDIGVGQYKEEDWTTLEAKLKRLIC